MLTLLIPNLSSAITFLISISIFSFVINQKGKWFCAIITASLMILLPITAYDKNLLHFSFNINVNYSTIILLSVAVVLAGISIVIAKSKRLEFVKQEGIAIIILSTIKLITQAIVLPFFFERPYEHFFVEGVCLLAVTVFVFLKAMVCSVYPSTKLISRKIRKQYFSDAVDCSTMIIQPNKGMDLITTTLTLQDRPEVKLYMFYIIEGDDDFKCPQKEWHIEESSYDNSKAAVFECFISNDEREIAKKILSSVKLLEEQNYENSFN